MKKKSSRRNLIINIGLVIILLSVAYYRFVIPNLQLTDINAQTLKGNPLDTNMYKGKPMIVNFWASWCGNCIGEFPDFESVKQHYGDGVNFLMISEDSIENIKHFAHSKGYTFNFVKSLKEFSDYGINTVPCTYLYDAEGNLVSKHVGTLDAEEVKEMVNQAL